MADTGKHEIDPGKDHPLASVIDDILSRGVTEYIDPNNTFRELLLAKASGTLKRDVVIKFGVDPTRPDIHLGHAVALRKLRQLQDIGCKVVFLIGDYTAQIGDPTGKSKVRPEVEQAEIEKNLTTYLEQVGKILKTDPSVFVWIRNSDWFTGPTDLSLPDDYEVTIEGKKIAPNSFLGKSVVFEKTRMQSTFGRQIGVITLRSVLWSLKHVTHAQLIERDMFQDRLRAGESLYMHEMLYPVLQGIDSHMLAAVFGSCDLELGGSDQTFNMLMGRKVMEINKGTPQAVLSVRLLVGLDGKEKMSKSLENYVGVVDEPRDMYGKIMSIPDTAITQYLELATYSDRDTVGDVAKGLASGSLHPKKEKMNLARQIVEIYHGREKAEEAERTFEQVFAKGEIPKDIEEKVVEKGTLLSETLLAAQIVSSKSDYRRLIDEGAIAPVDGEKITDPFFAIERTMTLRIGKKRFIRIVVE